MVLIQFYEISPSISETITFKNYFFLNESKGGIQLERFLIEELNSLGPSITYFS